MMLLIKNLNIKVKLGVMFLILCISILVLGYNAINISHYNQITLKELHSKSQSVLTLQNNIITPLYNLRQLDHSLVMAPNENFD